MNIFFFISIHTKFDEFYCLNGSSIELDHIRFHAHFIIAFVRFVFTIDIDVVAFFLLIFNYFNFQLCHENNDRIRIIWIEIILLNEMFTWYM